jgi:molybdopterin-biosynthesis enzyme MoeA-like protein
MPTQKNYENHTWMLEALKKAQDDDHDNREAAREAHRFVNDRDGQWEDKWREVYNGRPRYTFDLTNPMISQIEGSIAKSDYSIKVLPAGGKASKKAATKYEGIVRHIEAISNANEIYSKTGRSTAVEGCNGAEVVAAYQDGDSFDQDLMIATVPNWLNRVWLGPHTEQDGSDAPYGWKLVGMTQDEYEAKYPDRDIPSNVSTDETSQPMRYGGRDDLVLVGTFYYKKPVERELVIMSNGQTYVVDDDFKALADELTQLGITELRRRTRTVMKVCTRIFDNEDWIEKAKETVFENWIPLIPCYANFDYVDDCVQYYGAVEKMMDWQRVYNYGMTRKIEDVAFSPRSKYWITAKQAQGHEATLETLNTNNDPVQLWNPDPEAPGVPPFIGGAQINPGLSEITSDMQTGLPMSAGLFAASLGDNPGLQSGVAIDLLQERGDVGSNKYIDARTIFQRQIGRILVNAIPRVYDIGREVRILSDDGSVDMELIGQTIQDQQTGRIITLHDLSEGQYDVTCTAGPSFTNRQGQTVDALTKLGTVDPSVIQLGGDILANNVNGPGMEIIAKRKRRQLFTSGVLSPDELTEEEQQEMQANQQAPQEDPNMVLARAEEGKAQAEIVNAQTKQMQVKIDAAVKEKELEQKDKELMIDAYEAETDRFKADISRGTALAEIKGKGALAAKALSEAEAQDIENDAVKSGILSIVERLRG